MFKTLRIAGLALVAGLTLSGCADGYGRGDIGYGSGYYDGFGGPGYGYGDSYGWYGDYYYPGAGVYVYDRYRRPFRWNDGQRAYWQGRRGQGAYGNGPNGYRRDGQRGPVNRAGGPGGRGYGDTFPQGQTQQRDGQYQRRGDGQYRERSQGSSVQPAPGVRPSGGRQSAGEGRRGDRGRR